MNLLQMSFMGGAMILAVTVMRALAMHKVPKQTFLVLWGVVLVRLMIPFSLSSWFSIYSLWNWGVPAERLDMAAGVGIPLIPAGQGGVASQGAASAGANVSAPEIIWVIGCVVCGCFFAAAYWKSYREFQMSLPVRSEGVERWLKAQPTRRGIAVRQSGAVSSPLTYGVIHPVILLPKTTPWEDETTLRYVLTHELVHIKRFDMVTKMLLVATLCVHWFNPLVWVMYVLANRDIELSCDEAVIGLLGRHTRAVYAKTLISMEETRSGFTPLCNNFSRNAVEERITAIMKTRNTTVVSLALAAVMVAGTTTVFATSAHAGNDGSIQGTLISYTDGDGETWYVLEEGGAKRTLSAEEFEGQYPSPDIQWWTYDEYKSWLDNEREALQGMVGEKSWTAGQGWFVVTQEVVDKTIAEYEQILQNIKDGMMYSKTVDGKADVDIMVGYDPRGTVSCGGYELFVTLENGTQQWIGPYETPGQLLAAVESFCDEQVKLGNMDQQEAGEIIGQCVPGANA